MIIGYDIDNVIADLDKTLLEEFLLEDKSKRNKGIINFKAKHITEGMFDWTKEEIYDFLKNNMDRMSLDFEPVDNAKYYIDKLKRENNKIYLVTHRGASIFKNAELVTKQWLKDNEIFYDKLIFTKSNDKSPECLENKIDIMFDDIAQNCLYLKENGISSYLMKTRYNQKYNFGVEMVNDWENIYKVIQELKNESEK